MSEEIEHMLAAAAELDALRSADALHRIDLELPDGTRLRGSVSGCCGGDAPGPLHIMYNRFKPKYQASMLIGLLALTAQDPSVRWRGVLITRGSGKDPAEPCVRVVRGGSPEERRHHATSALATLVGQFRDGLRYPLPLFDASSYELVTDPKGVVRSWGTLVKDDWSYRKESQDPHHQLAFGRLDLDDLMALDAGGHTFGAEARRLWSTLDAAVQPDGEEAS
jgi:exonuclease V gamma subunit